MPRPQRAGTFSEGGATLQFAAATRAPAVSGSRRYLPRELDEVGAPPEPALEPRPVPVTRVPHAGAGQEPSISPSKLDSLPPQICIPEKCSELPTWGVRHKKSRHSPSLAPFPSPRSSPPLRHPFFQRSGPTSTFLSHLLPSKVPGAKWDFGEPR